MSIFAMFYLPKSGHLANGSDWAQYMEKPTS